MTAPRQIQAIRKLPVTAARQASQLTTNRSGNSGLTRFSSHWRPNRGYFKQKNVAVSRRQLIQSAR